MFPVEQTESFTSAKENYHSNRLMAEKNSFHGRVLFPLTLSLRLHDALNALPVLVMLLVICQCGQTQAQRVCQGEQMKEFTQVALH